MKYLSTFSGVGGFELGIQQAYEKINESNSNTITQQEQPKERAISERGNSTNPASINGNRRRASATCIGYSEIDKYAVQVYNKHFNHKNYGDIKKIKTDELPDFELLVGGFPCQSFSIAGKRGGFEDTRGTMFFELARILRAKQPRLFVFENVKGLLSHDSGRTFKTIIQTLDELGYDVQWQVLNSKYHGVPQSRERVFIVGNLRGTSRPEVFPIRENEKLSDQASEPTESQPQTKPASTIRTKQGTRADDNYIIQASRGKNKGGKKEICPTISASRFEMNNCLFTDNAIRKLTPVECERLQGFPEIEKYDIIEVCKDNQRKNVNAENQSRKSQKLVGNVEKKDSQENAKYVARFLNTKNQQTNKLAQPDVLINCEENGVEIHSQGKLLLSAEYAEKKNWCHQHIKIGDFVQTLVGINTILEKITNYGEAELQKNERCLTLQKNGKRLENKFGKEIMQPVGNVESDLITLKKLLKSTTLNHLDIKSLEQKLATLSSFVIRAIIGYIPKEIKNQNIFTIAIKNKYGWTKNGTDGEISDTQRYKMMGNAVTVNVVEYIMSKLARVL